MSSLFDFNNLHIWNFTGLLFILFLATTHSQAGSLFTILLSLPSTILHELAHALAVTLTGGQVVNFSISPKSYQTENGKKVWALGQVLARVGLFSAFPYAVAPLIFLPAAFWISHNLHIFPISPLGSILSYWVMYVFIRASFLSWPDIKILYLQPTSTALYCTLIIISFLARDFFTELYIFLSSQM